MRIKLSRLLFYISFWGLIFYTIVESFTGQWVSNGFIYSYVTHVPTQVVLVKYLAIISLFVLSVYSFSWYNHYVGTVERILDLFLLLYFAFYLLKTVLDHDLLSTLFSSVSVLVICLPIMKYVGMNDDIWTLIRKNIPIVLILSFGCCLVTFFQYIGNFLVYQVGSAPFKMTFGLAITAMWVYCFANFNKAGGMRIYTAFFLLLICALITRSRAWIIQTSALILIYIVNHDDRNHHKIAKFLISVALILLAGVVITYLFPAMTEELVSRAFEDTRSGQYEVFFEQHSPMILLFGGGMDASYHYGGNYNYVFFDNQFMFVAFHYGLLPVISILGTFFNIWKFKPNNFLNSSDYQNIKAAKFCALLLCTVYAGFSVYYQISFGLISFLCFAYFGHSIKNAKINQRISV